VALPPLEGPQGVRTIVSTGEQGVSLRNAITKYCQDPVAAIKWLDAGYSEAARMFGIYGGLEGEAWEYADGETVSGAGKVVKYLSEMGENACWGSQGIVYRVTEADYQAMDASEIATNSALATYQANLAYRPYMVQNPWPPIVWPGGLQEEASQFSEINGLIKTAVSEYYSEVIRGNKNLDADWDAYVKSLNDMGLARYMELVDLYIANDAQKG